MKWMSCHKHSKPNIRKQHCELYDQCLPLEEVDWKHRCVCKEIKWTLFQTHYLSMGHYTHQKSFHCCRMKYKLMKEPYVAIV
jgi:hypothetical protein